MKKYTVRALLVLILLFVFLYNTSCANCYIPPINFGLPKAVEILPATNSCASPLDTSKGGLLGALITILFGNTNTLTTPKTIAVGNFGVVYYTIDGQTWIPKQIDATSGLNFKSIIYTGTRFIAAGGTSTSCSIYYSDKGIDWTKATITNTCLDPINGLAMGNGLIVGVGGVNTFGSNAMTVVSNDGGLTWTATNPGPVIWPIEKITFNNGFFILSYYNSGLFQIDVYRSTTGSGFALTPNQPFIGTKGGCVNGELITINTTRTILAGTDCPTGPGFFSISKFTDNAGSTAWTSNASFIFGNNSIPEVARGLAMGGTRLVAVGDNCRVDYSDNPTGALNWNFNGAMTGCTAGTVWNDAVHDGTRFIAVGKNASNMGVMAISPTGNPTDWTVSTAVGGTAALNAIVSK